MEHSYTFRRTLFCNLTTTLLFFITGYLAMPLTSPPSYAGIIWPPVGIALGANLRWGNRILPGVFLGDFLIKFYVYDLSTLLESPWTLLMVLLMALASTFRSWFGSYLIHQYIGFPNPLISVKSIVGFFLLGCVSATFLTSVISISILYALDVLSQSDLFFSTLFWWMGDSIGAVVFAPLFFMLFSDEQRNWKQRRLSVGVPLMLTLLIAILTFQYAKSQEENRLKSLIVEQTTKLQQSLESDFNFHVENLEFIKTYFQTSPSIKHHEFDEFTEGLVNKNNYIQSISWIEKNIDESGQADFKVKHSQFNEQIRNPINLNYANNSELIIALKDAIRLNQPVATRSTDINTNDAEQTGFVIFFPVFRKNPVNQEEMEFIQLQGILTLVLNQKLMIEHLLSDLKLQSVIVRIFEQQADQTQKLVFESMGQESMTKSDPLKLGATKLVQLPGYFWLIQLLPDADFIGYQYSWTVSTVLAVGMIFTCILTIGLLILTGQSELIKGEVLRRTEDLNRSHSKLEASELQFRNLVQAQSAIVWRADPETFRFTFVSNEAENIFGYPVANWIEETNFWEEHLHPDDKKWVPQRFAEAISNMQSLTFDYRMIAADGKTVWLHDAINLMQEGGKITQIVGCMIDITRQKQSEEQLRLAATTFESQEGIMITDKDAIILRVNKAFTDITGYPTEDVLGKTPSILNSGQHSKEFFHQYWQKIIHEGKIEGEIWNRRKNGQVYPEWQTVTAVKNDRGEISHFVSVFSDITEKKEAENKIHSMAFYDPLTDLPNRRLLLNRLEQEVAVAERHKQFGSVIFLDLDHFKILNDSLGHHVGDELLIQVANRLRTVVREEDTPARLGGDEFVVLVHANSDCLMTAADHALLVAEKIKTVLNEQYFLNGFEHHFTPSIGITLFPENNFIPVEILQQSDTAMYRSKASGRNAISFYHVSMQETADARLSLEKELRNAITKGRFVLCFQPQVNSHGKVVSAEALIRWMHPDKGLVEPSEFIPIAEETSLILPIGNWVLHEACEQIKIWEMAGLNVIPVAVNVGSRQFRQDNFVEQAQKILLQYNIQPQHLKIELTERVVIDNIEDTISKMSALKELGVSIAVDDFGTGYSSLAYLKQLPIDVLKIDQSFINDITTDPNDAVIVETIIVMSQHLGLNVIAEGVENEQQLDFLKAKGCKIFQGYYFGHPVPADKFTKLLS